MNLIELFRQKQIHISPESSVQVGYITVKNVADLYTLVKGEMVLVKRQLSMEDLSWLRTLKGNCDIFTQQPGILDTFDVIQELKHFASVQIIDSVGLSFLHSEDTLYVFDSILDRNCTSTTPNVVRLFPVHRKEIETYLSIDKAVLEAIAKVKPADGDSESAGEEQKKNSKGLYEQDPEQLEQALVRKKLSELFSSRYTEVRVEFSGTSPENRTISLSRFYEKQGIERGQLRGSWTLFEKKDRKDILDAGIVNRAKEVELNAISVTIPTYGRIIRSGDLEQLREKMAVIERDYRAYLDGDEKCKKVGSITVQKRFSPTEVIAESFARLEDYLHRIGMDVNANKRYHDDVDAFMRKERQKQESFSKLVKLQITSSTYTESQWANKDFVDRFWKAVSDNPDFFDEEIIGLLDRYIELFYQKS